MINKYITISNNKIITEEKKSKFISESFSVSTIDEAKCTIDNVVSSSRDASHHVYAFVLLNNYSKMSDDGEPAGTGGIQILNAINSFRLKNTLIVVTRYFGGIKLGIGGLSRAYFNCAKNLIEKSKIIEKNLCYEISLDLSYKEYNKIIKMIELKIVDIQFDLDVHVKLAIHHNEIEKFKSIVERELTNKTEFKAGDLKYL